MGRWRASCPALIIRLVCIVLQSVTARKRFFRTFPARGRFFVVQRVCIAYRRRGWPATDGAGVRVEDGSKAGAKVWYAFRNSPNC